MFAIQKASVGIGPLCKSAYPRGSLVNTIVNRNAIEGIRQIYYFLPIVHE